MVGQLPSAEGCLLVMVRIVCASLFVVGGHKDMEWSLAILVSALPPQVLLLQTHYNVKMGILTCDSLSSTPPQVFQNSITA